MSKDWSLDPLEMSSSEFGTYELIDIRELDEDPSGRDSRAVAA